MANAHVVPIVCTLLLFVVAQLEMAQTPAFRFPDPLESYLTNAVKLPASDRQRLIEGAPVSRMLKADETKEVAVFGASWINAPIGRYVQAIKDIESFERGGRFKLTKRISAPPRLEDFAPLRLPEQDIADLRTCRVGACKVKLGEHAIERVRSGIDSTAPTARAAANRLMRQLAFEYVTRYLEGGNDQLAVYRDDSRPTFVAQELRTIVNHMPALALLQPNVSQYLLEYPSSGKV